MLFERRHSGCSTVGSIQETTYGYTLCAVHCEHGIRGEDSLSDARFVAELCEKWNVPLYAFSENCPLRAERDKQSLETAARAFRIECFQRLLAEEKADVIYNQTK